MPLLLQGLLPFDDERGLNASRVPDERGLWASSVLRSTMEVEESLLMHIQGMLTADGDGGTDREPPSRERRGWEGPARQAPYNPATSTAGSDWHALTTQWAMDMWTEAEYPNFLFFSLFF